MPYIINTDGTIEEWSFFDLAAEIGLEVQTPAGLRLRWQAACVDGQWGVVDARRPHDLVLGTEDEDEAKALAAEWNVCEGLMRDPSRLNRIHFVARSLEQAEALAGALKKHPYRRQWRAT